MSNSNNTSYPTPMNDANAKPNGHKKKGWKNKNKNKNNYKKKFNKGNKNKLKSNKNDKIKFRIQKMINKTQFLKDKKQNDINLLNNQQTQLQQLLDDADNLDIKTLKLKIKLIVQSNKPKRNKNHHKFGKRRNKHNNNDKYNDKAQKKADKADKKADKKLEKERRKAERAKVKEQKRLAKEERKRIKREKLAKLEAARLPALPANKTEIGNKNVLNIYIDGYNIIGCDSLCRKSMRGKMRSARIRLIKLLQSFMDNKSSLNIDYDIIMRCWFDGGNINQNHQSGDIQIQFSTKKQIVDDKLVELFSKNSKNNNSNILVVTTDKELTCRLHDIGVKVIKSSTFYKTYLVKDDVIDVSIAAPVPVAVPVPSSVSNDNDNDDQKQTVINASGITDDNDAIFSKYASNKMHSRDDDTPDEMDDDNDDNMDDFDVTFGGDDDMDIYIDSDEQDID